MPKKVKPTRYKTPLGIAKYPYLTTPDNFKDQLKWKVNVVVDPTDPEWQAHKDLIDSLVDDAFQEKVAELKGKAKKETRKYYPYDDEYDPETGEPTGNLVFKFRRPAAYVCKKTGDLKSINIGRVDAKGKPISVEDLGNPGNGTTLRIAWEPYGFHSPAGKNAGITLRIASVQFVKVEQFNGDTAWEPYESEDDSGEASVDHDDADF